MLGWRWKEALPGRGDDDSKCGGPLKSKQSRSDGGSGGKEWWVTTNSAGGGVREGGGGGGGDGSGGGEGGMEKGKTTTWDDSSSSSRVVMQRRRRMCGDGRGADARTHATLQYTSRALPRFRRERMSACQSALSVTQAFLSLIAMADDVACCKCSS